MSGIHYIGGLVGWGSGNITNSYATGNVNGTSDTGGLVGLAANANITNSYATGNVSISDTKAGGLVGQLRENSTVSNSYATGKVSGSDWLGGLAGQKQSDSTLSTSFFDIDKTGQSNAIGRQTEELINVKGLTTEQMQDPDNWTAWDSSVWDFSSFPPTLKPFVPEPTPEPEPSTGNIRLQVGANSDSFINSLHIDTLLQFDDFYVDFSSDLSCASAIDDIDALSDLLNNKRSEFGAYINRLYSVLDSQYASIENLSAAKSTIMDADIAQEAAVYVKNQILQQTSTALLTQAQYSNNSILMALVQ